MSIANRFQLVTDLPGIGPANGGRLNNAGYYMASEIYDVFKSYNFDRNRCEEWLYSVCHAYSNHASMCYEALREWHRQFDDYSYSPIQQKQQLYRNETPEFGFLNNVSLQQSPKRTLYTPVQSLAQASPERTLYTPVQSLAPAYPDRTLYTPVQSLAQASPERTLYTPVQSLAQASPLSSRSSDISKAEIMQMMAEFQKKQDAMATQIRNLEQEKLKTDSYVKTLETKIEVMDKKATELERRHEVQIAALTKKLGDMDRTERYRNISSSIYLLNQKFDDLLTELNEEKQKSSIHTYIKALEARIQYIDKNAVNIQKEQNENFLILNNKISDTFAHTERYKKAFSSIDLLALKLDEMIKQQNDVKEDKISPQKSKDTTIKQLGQELRNLTIEIENVVKKTFITKENNEKLTEKTNVQKNNTHSKNKNDQLKRIQLSS